MKKTKHKYNYCYDGFIFVLFFLLSVISKFIRSQRKFRGNHHYKFKLVENDTSLMTPQNDNRSIPHSITPSSSLKKKLICYLFVNRISRRQRKGKIVDSENIKK